MKKEFLGRLSSRKFLSPFIFGVLVALNNAITAEFGVGLTDDQVKDVFALVAIFVGAEGLKDTFDVIWRKK